MDFDQPKIAVSFEYSSSNTSFSKGKPVNEKGFKYRPDAVSEFSCSESGVMALHVRRTVPEGVKDERAREFVYLLNDNKLALKRKGESKLYVDKSAGKMEEPPFWKYLTHIPIHENHQLWPRIADFLRNPDLFDSVEVSEMDNNRQSIVFRGKKGKNEHGEFADVVSVSLEKFENNLYPVSISHSETYFSEDGAPHQGPDIISIEYGGYVKLDKAGLYVPREIESKKYDVTVTGSYGFDQELKYAEKVKVENISESNELIERKTVLKIDGETTIYDSSSNQKFVIDSLLNKVGKDMEDK